VDRYSVSSLSYSRNRTRRLVYGCRGHLPRALKKMRTARSAIALLVGKINDLCGDLGKGEVMM